MKDKIIFIGFIILMFASLFIPYLLLYEMQVEGWEHITKIISIFSFIVCQSVAWMLIAIRGMELDKELLNLNQEGTKK